jgi:ribonuclease P protein component
MIPYKNRFHGHGSLRYVYRNGLISKSRFITLKSVKDKKSISRIAVVVSKKILKSAVGRNRIRRRIYEIIRNIMPELNDFYDIALIVNSSEVRTIEQKELHKIILEQLKDNELL